MSTESIPTYMPVSLADDFARWKARSSSASSSKVYPTTFEQLKNDLKAAFEQLPEKVSIPFERTVEGERLTKFLTLCPEEFRESIKRPLLRDPEAFDKVVLWTGSFPGPVCFGTTSTAKTRAAWSVLRTLWVVQGIGFSWRPARQLMQSIEEDKGSIEGLVYRNAASKAWFVDDLDKINWQFASHAEALFAFYDWIYRSNIPCITTTNQDRKWWSAKMGDAFARRLFDEAHFPVQFGNKSRVLPGNAQRDLL